MYHWDWLYFLFSRRWPILNVKWVLCWLMQLRAIRKLGGQRDFRMDGLQNTLSLVMFMLKEKKERTADKGCLPPSPLSLPSPAVFLLSTDWEITDLQAQSPEMLNSKWNASQDLCWTNCFSKVAFGPLKGCLGYQSKTSQPRRITEIGWEQVLPLHYLIKLRKKRSLLKKTLKQKWTNKNRCLSRASSKPWRVTLLGRVSFIFFETQHVFCPHQCCLKHCHSALSMAHSRGWWALIPAPAWSCVEQACSSRLHRPS